MDEYLSKYHLFNLEWLSIPAIYALLIWIIQRFFEYEVTFFYTTYALLMGIWSQMFLRSWDRKCSELTIEWDNFTTEYDKENVRSDFVGEIRKSPITEKEEKFFPKQKRIYLFIMSGIRAIPYLCFALFTMVCFLNLTGVIKEEDKSVLEIEFLNRLAQKGYINKIKIVDGLTPIPLLELLFVLCSLLLYCLLINNIEK